MEHFTNDNFKNFLTWLKSLSKNEICNDFVDDENPLEDLWFIFIINGIQDDYYDIISKNLNDSEKEEIVNSLKTEYEYIDEDDNIIICDDLDYPDDALYFLDVYIENRNTGFKMLYGTYYTEGFEIKYQIEY